MTIPTGIVRRFLYPPEFTSLPEYSAYRGKNVAVVRPLRDDEADGPSVDPAFEQMYLIRCDDGRELHAFESELV